MDNSIIRKEYCRFFSAPGGEETGSSPSSLLLGYGNIDRQDDGVAWHILRLVASRLQADLPLYPKETHIELNPLVAVHFELQLTPEISELVAGYSRVAFIDAHTGRVEQSVYHENLQPEFVTSPFTHHLTPSTCLSLAETIYEKVPTAILVSVRGYEFGFARSLSSRTMEHAEVAADWLVNWLHQGK